MPQLTKIVLTDATAAPHEFKPREIAAGVATLVESTGVPIGDRRITMSLTRTKDSGRVKPTFKIAFPVVDNAVVNGVTRATVVRTNYAEISFNFDPTSTSQERDNMLVLMKHLLDGNENTMVVGHVINLEGLY